ncbi:MAG: CpXC domain-containing protein [Oscillospiraceae bacterium]
MEPQTMSLHCPICQKDHDAPLWRVVDADEKELKEKLLDKTLFDFSCPDCGYTSRLEYSTIYVDRGLGLQVYLAPCSGEVAADIESEALRFAKETMMPQKADCIRRIVASIEDLKEKLLLFEAGYDDRITEICKGFALSQFPADDSFYVTGIRFDVMGGRELLRLRCSDDSEQYVLDFDGFYREIEAQTADRLPPLRGGGFERVDLEYAAGLMRGMQEGE